MYQVQNPIEKAMGGMNQAAGTYGRMMRDIPANRDPGPTIGGGAMAGMGGAVAGAQLGTMVGGATTTGAAAATGAATGSSAGPWGAAAGAIIGIGAYLLS